MMRRRDVIALLEAQRLLGRLQRAFLIGGPPALTSGIASQPECPQPRGLFSHGVHLGVVVGRCLLGLPRLLFLLNSASARRCASVEFMKTPS
jgi:hypothetical protein